MTSPKQVRFGVVGIHSFSRSHIGAIQALAAADTGVRLVAASAYQRELDEPYAAKLEQQGVRLTPTVDELLALGRQQLDVVTVPTGIGLHVPISVQALQAGFPVLVEKPVSGAIQEVDELIAARDRAALPVLVGFQYMYAGVVRKLKQALLDGRLGRVREVRCLTCWPRAESYYRRNSWAGKLRWQGSWILDSPVNNACAHYLLLCLYFADDQAPPVAKCARVRAELYRAYPIESPDTASIEIETQGGVRVLFLVTHAANETMNPHIRILGDKGEASWDAKDVTIDIAGNVEHLPSEANPMNPFKAMVEALRGNTSVAQCPLEMARPHTVAVNAAHLSSPVRAVPSQFVSREAQGTPPGRDVQYCISGIAPALRDAFGKGVSLSDLKALDWAQPGAWVDARKLDRFPGPCLSQDTQGV